MWARVIAVCLLLVGTEFHLFLFLLEVGGIGFAGSLLSVGTLGVIYYLGVG